LQIFGEQFAGTCRRAERNIPGDQNVFKRRYKMKQRKTRKLAVLLGIALAGGTSALVMPVTTPAHAQYYAPDSSASVMLNGQPLATSIPPMVDNGHTLVPMRDIFQALGATVVWNPNDSSIAAQKGTTHVWLQIGNKAARVDNRQVWLAQAPVVSNGSTLVPLRFVSEALGAEVSWNGAQRIVNINMSGLVYHPRNNGNNHHQWPGNKAHSFIVVPADSVVPVRLNSRLSSQTARKGDVFWTTVVSSHVGDSEFPQGTELKGVVTDVTRRTNNRPGAIRVDFRGIKFPNGSTQSIDGSLVSLDKNDVRQANNGRIVATHKKSSGGGADSTTVLIGAGAGYVLGHVLLGQNSILSGALGALGGYLYGNNKNDKSNPREAVVPAGTKLGVRLDEAVRYEDDYGYETHRAPYLR